MGASASKIVPVSAVVLVICVERGKEGGIVSGEKLGRLPLVSPALLTSVGRPTFFRFWGRITCVPSPSMPSAPSALSVRPDSARGAMAPRLAPWPLGSSKHSGLTW